MLRRSAEDYGEAFARLFPSGKAWPRDEDSTFQRVIRGLAAIMAEPDKRIADLVEIEADPRTTMELFTEWERAYGLPDPCIGIPQSLTDRRKALLAKITMKGSQSRAFFVGLAATLGYTITITEYAPFMCGVSRVGDTRATGTTGEPYRWTVGPQTMRYVWRVFVGATRFTWFRVGGDGGQVGVDPLLRISLATDLECVFRRLKPAHTEVVFGYSAALPTDPFFDAAP